MATDLVRGVLVLLVGLVASVRSAQAQAPLFLVNPSTQVAAVDFEFSGGQSFSRDLLQSRLGTIPRGTLAGLRDRLSFLPLIDESARHPFSPVELQKDLIRIRRLYAESGFLDPAIRYDVELDTASNTVDVRFLITEGRPILLEELIAETPEGTEVTGSLHQDLTREWARFEARLRRDNLNRRVGPAQVRALRDRTESWFRDHGYPTPRLEATLSVDSASARAHVVLAVDMGVRRRLGTIIVEGNREIEGPVLSREFPIRASDWYSASALREGERQLYGLDMIRWADARELPDSGASEGPLGVRVQVQEGPKRLISGRVGYATSSGLTGQASWSHRNFAGGARVLTLATEARTGYLAADETSEERYGVSLTLRQPYLGSPHLSGLLTPFFEYRDGPIDESIRNGIDATAVYELGGINTLALQYRIAAREVFQYRFGTLTDGGLDFLALQAILDDSIGAVTRESRITASGTWGRIDDRSRPNRGLVTRLAMESAGPAALSKVEFAKLTGEFSGFYPLGRDFRGHFRVFGGRVWPFGKSIPDAPESGLIRFLELRDALLTAGGTGDVRGWADGLLGPKTPDYRIVDLGDSLAVRADRFIPVGGFAKVGFSAELAVPLPGTARRHSAFLFLDGGRLWTSDDRYGIPDPYDEEEMFFGAGAGLEFSTAVGPVRVALGYKLNPSPLDVRDPLAVQRALADEMPISSVSAESIRRFQLHIDLGNPF